MCFNAPITSALTELGTKAFAPCPITTSANTLSQPTSTMPSQLQLKIRDVRYSRPTMGVETARGVLDITEDAVIQLIERGAFWAWDISAPGARRRMLRILSASVSAMTHDRAVELLEDQLALVTPFPATAEAAIALVMSGVPKDKPFVTAKDIKRALNFGRTHMNDLVDAGALPELAGTTRRPGPNGHAVIHRDAFVAFLKDRLVC